MGCTPIQIEEWRVMAAEPLFHYEIEESVDPFDLKVYTIKCFGKLVSETGDQLKEVVKPLIDKGGSAIVLDFGHAGRPQGLGDQQGPGKAGN
jgi:hypothetical protein